MRIVFAGSGKERVFCDKEIRRDKREVEELVH